MTRVGKYTEVPRAQRLGIERRARAHVVADIGNGDDQPEARRRAARHTPHHRNRAHPPHRWSPAAARAGRCAVRSRWHRPARRRHPPRAVASGGKSLRQIKARDGRLGRHLDRALRIQALLDATPRAGAEVSEAWRTMRAMTQSPSRAPVELVERHDAAQLQTAVRGNAWPPAGPRFPPCPGTPSRRDRGLLHLTQPAVAGIARQAHAHPVAVHDSRASPAAAGTHSSLSPSTRTKP